MSGGKQNEIFIVALLIIFGLPPLLMMFGFVVGVATSGSTSKREAGTLSCASGFVVLEEYRTKDVVNGDWFSYNLVYRSTSTTKQIAGPFINVKSFGTSRAFDVATTTGRYFYLSPKLFTKNEFDEIFTCIHERMDTFMTLIIPAEESMYLHWSDTLGTSRSNENHIHGLIYGEFSTTSLAAFRCPNHTEFVPNFVDNGVLVKYKSGDDEASGYFAMTDIAFNADYSALFYRLSPHFVQSVSDGQLNGEPDTTLIGDYIGSCKNEYSQNLFDVFMPDLPVRVLPWK